MSYLKARNMNSNGCAYHVFRKRDVDSGTPINELVQVVKEFSEDFPDKLPVIPPTREIDFGIDFFPIT